MKAMILAAGRGSRMSPLTDNIPKPLVSVKGKPLIVHHCERLAAAGFKEVVINLAYLGQKIQDTLRDGKEWNLQITYSPEGDTGLETGGGILNALPLLGDEPFITINADILTNFDFHTLSTLTLPPSIMANLILIPHKNDRTEGDFFWSPDTLLVGNQFPRSYTAAGITLYHPKFFEGLEQGKFSITPLWRQFADQGKILGFPFHGEWRNVENIQTVNELNALI